MSEGVANLLLIIGVFYLVGTGVYMFYWAFEYSYYLDSYPLSVAESRKKARAARMLLMTPVAPFWVVTLGLYRLIRDAFGK